LTALVGSERIGALLRKEKDEASLPIRFRQGSSNAFIPRFAELKAFLFFILILILANKPMRG